MEQFWDRVIKIYMVDLRRIIQNCPIVRRNIIVFRGEIKDHIFSNLKDNMYRTDNFISSTLDLDTATEFAGCCIQKITILSNTHALPIIGVSQFFEEQEVLLGGESVVFYVKQQKDRFIGYCGYDEYIADKFVDIKEIVLL